MHIATTQKITYIALQYSHTVAYKLVLLVILPLEIELQSLPFRTTLRLLGFNTRELPTTNLSHVTQTCTTEEGYGAE